VTGSVVVPELAWTPTSGPLVSVYLDDDDPMWSDGPWRVLNTAARRAGWSVRGFFARSRGLTATGGVGALTDAVSLRFDKAGRGAVGVWARTTWPIMGRAVRGEDDTQTGGGRKDNTGRTWLWHPPRVLPEEGLPTAKWSFGSGWLWPTDAAVQPQRAQARDVKEWIIR
jgi:hypothetical protein